MRGRSQSAADFLEQARIVWQAKTCRKLSDHDLDEIVHNLTAYLSLLMDWENEENKKGQK
jgi:hypothetical protein